MTERSVQRDAAGLYDPSFERDSCGFGLIANLDDLPSHWVVATAIDALARLTHRGAVAADGKTGDGCGLLIKFPESFMRSVAGELGFDLAGRFAAVPTPAHVVFAVDALAKQGVLALEAPDPASGRRGRRHPAGCPANSVTA